MQFAKDSVYVALRDRLAGINPDRVITIGGNSRPALLVRENQQLDLHTSISNLRNTFELQWGSCEAVSSTESSGHPLMKLGLRISYSVEGTDVTGNDRGRALGTMDTELAQMCRPRSAPKQDYSQAQPTTLGSNVFWSELQFSAPEDKHGVMSRTALLTVFFFPEVEAA